MLSAVRHSRLAARLHTGLVFCLGALCTQLVSGTDDLQAIADTNQVFRLAFMSSMFSEVNESDARAAMKVWILTVATERQIAVDPAPRIFRTIDELLAYNRTNRVDGVGLVASEYARLSQTMKFERLGVGEYAAGIMEEYIVLVRADSGVEHLDQLQGRTLNVLNTPRMSLATVWLDTALVEAGQKPCANFFRPINANNKASLVTLPVFFHQADACLTTRNSFKVLGELNPQLAKQLRVLAASPGLLPTCFAFCAHAQSPLRPQILTEMARMKESPAGRQILTLVKADDIVEAPLTSLDSTLELLAKHQRLCGGEKAAETGVK